MKNDYYMVNLHVVGKLLLYFANANNNFSLCCFCVLFIDFSSEKSPSQLVAYHFVLLIPVHKLLSCCRTSLCNPTNTLNA
jgi:hypothetical protein